MTSPDLPPGGPWWLRAVPVLALVALLGTGAAMASPSLRHQLDVSTHRLSHPYVELAFASPTSARTCSRAVNASGVQVALRSHLDAPTRFSWNARVTPRGRAAGPARHGTLTLAPGGTGGFAVPLPRSTRPYTITITLTGRAERLSLHCTGAHR